MLARHALCWPSGSPVPADAKALAAGLAWADAGVFVYCPPDVRAISYLGTWKPAGCRRWRPPLRGGTPLVALAAVLTAWT